MAGVTYLIRMLPITLCKQKLTNTFVRSFLYYIPYTVLGAMTFPAILYSTGSIYSAITGLAAAIVLAMREKGLLTVALSSYAAAFITDILIR